MDEYVRPHCDGAVLLTIDVQNDFTRPAILQRPHQKPGLDVAPGVMRLVSVAVLLELEPGLRTDLTLVGVRQTDERYVVCQGYDEIMLVTDGRFSGATRGPMIGHVAPEAAVGGPIAAVEDGDTIVVDLPSRSLDVEVSAEELAERLADWQPPAIEAVGGAIALCGAHFDSGARGATTNPSLSRSAVNSDS